MATRDYIAGDNEITPAPRMPTKRTEGGAESLVIPKGQVIGFAPPVLHPPAMETQIIRPSASMNLGSFQCQNP